MQILLHGDDLSKVVEALKAAWPVELNATFVLLGKVQYGVLIGSPESLIKALERMAAFSVHDENGAEASHAELIRVFKESLDSRLVPGLSDNHADDGWVLGADGENRIVTIFYRGCWAPAILKQQTAPIRAEIEYHEPTGDESFLNRYFTGRIAEIRDLVGYLGTQRNSGVSRWASSLTGLDLGTKQALDWLDEQASLQPAMA